MHILKRVCVCVCVCVCVWCIELLNKILRVANSRSRRKALILYPKLFTISNDALEETVIVFEF